MTPSADQPTSVSPASPTSPVSPASSEPAAQPGAEAALDLGAVEQRLADVEVALARLDSGEYWKCEVTGSDLPDDLLAADPTARRLPGR